MWVIITVLSALLALSEGQTRSAATTTVRRSSASNAAILPWANSLPTNRNRYQRVLFGESKTRCIGTNVNIQITNANEEVVLTNIKTAVARAVANNVNKPDSIKAAEDTAVAVLNVVATAVGKVTVSVLSKRGGCWGIGFGRATARAYAEGTVTALAQALSRATGRSVQTEFDAITSDSATNVSEVIDSTAALLGWGGGGTNPRVMTRKVVVQAKVNVMACAIAKAFAVAKGEDARGVALAYTGCQQATKVTPKSVDNEVACRCRNFGQQPRNCRQHGIGGSNDFICYVSDPRNCACTQGSSRYPGQKWRFCGKTLGEMQVWLNVQDNKNGIQPTPSRNGYCGAFDSRKDN
eukprot:TRINITY_DN1519_c0_g1_i1.p1 TRINITY_DN1519_c0_g1~~TRINITY_DN1519_c0_g1_i1.p1  ORF type:complete len:351 (+),score=41.90 TRINITY_DN1519_c0_g1_i1:146-1198(+)